MPGLVSVGLASGGTAGLALSTATPLAIYFVDPSSPITDGGNVRHISKHRESGAIVREYDLRPTWTANNGDAIGSQAGNLLVRGADSASLSNSVWKLDPATGTPSLFISGLWNDGTLGTSDGGPYTDDAGYVYQVFDTTLTSGNGQGTLRRWEPDGSTYTDFAFTAPIPPTARTGPAVWVKIHVGREYFVVSPDGAHLYAMILWTELPPPNHNMGGVGDDFTSLVRWSIPGMTSEILFTRVRARTNTGGVGTEASNTTPAIQAAGIDALSIDQNGDVWMSYVWEGRREFLPINPLTGGYSGVTQVAPDQYFLENATGTSGVRVDLSAVVPGAHNGMSVTLSMGGQFVPDGRGHLFGTVAIDDTTDATYLLKLAMSNGAVTVEPDYAFTNFPTSRFLAIPGDVIARTVSRGRPQIGWVGV